MPGCSHPCRLCAVYTDTGAHIHPQWSNTWMSARICVHNTHAHMGIHTRFEMHTSNVNLPVRREAEWRYIIIHPVCLVFFFEKKKGRKTNLFTKFDTNLYPSPFFFFFFFFFLLHSGFRSTTSFLHTLWPSLQARSTECVYPLKHNSMRCYSPSENHVGKMIDLADKTHLSHV